MSDRTNAPDEKLRKNRIRARNLPVALIGVLLLALGGLAMTTTGCGSGGAEKLPGVTDIDRGVDSTGIVPALKDTPLAGTNPRGSTLQRIKRRDSLVAITGYNPVSYFLYRGEPMGYEYELLQTLADHLGVALEVTLMEDQNEMFEALKNGEADLVAYRLAVTQRRAEQVAFTDPLHATRQVLVQQMPERYDSLRAGQIPETSPAADSLLQYPFELVTQNDTVHITEDSPFQQRLNNLGEEMGGEIDVIQVDSEVPREKLIQRVANGDIDYTVANETIAELNKAYYGDIAIRPVLSVNQQIAWALRDDRAWELGNVINAWLAGLKEQDDFRRIYDKYFTDRKGFSERRREVNIKGQTEKLTKYDDLVKTTLDSSKLGWDWRLLMAQMWQESKFEPQAQSWAGAQGLMQIMPGTARKYVNGSVFDPKDNIEGAIDYLEFLNDYWSDKIKDPKQRRRFILASYNVGFGHLEDARRLTEKYGGNKNTWEDVSKWLLRKSMKKYYTDDVVKYGYARGEEPVAYVRHITERFEQYENLVSA
jgi:membrane-bound lytic murein transglycosylase F